MVQEKRAAGHKLQGHSEPSGLSPTWWGLGLPALLRVQSPGSVPPLPASHLPPMLGWADKNVLHCQEPSRLVDKSGHCPPLPGAYPSSLGTVPEEPLHPWVLGRSPTPQPQNACTPLWALDKKNHEYVPGAGSC